MGIIPMTKVMVRRIAPMGDPIEIRLRGYGLSIRHDDAMKIEGRNFDRDDPAKIMEMIDDDDE